MASAEAKVSIGLLEGVQGPGPRKLMQRKSTIAFLMTLPLITLIIALVAYPAGSAIYLSMLDRGMTRFVGLGNFARLLGRDSFWMVVSQTSLFAITAVACKAILGFAAGAAVSLCMVPVLAVAAPLILRGIARRGGGS